MKVERRLARHALNLWWLDGNHEDFERLAARPISEDGRRQVSDHIWHLLRGYGWTWNRTVWLAVGGAVSVDKEFRTQGKTWFEAEELTVEEADRIVPTDRPTWSSRRMPPWECRFGALIFDRIDLLGGGNQSGQSDFWLDRMLTSAESERLWTAWRPLGSSAATTTSGTATSSELLMPRSLSKASARTLIA